MSPQFTSENELINAHGRNLLSVIAAEQPEMLVSALEANPVCITVADATRPDMPLAYVNPAFEEATGYSLDEVVGRNCRFLQGPDTDMGAVAALRDAIASECPVAVEFDNYRKDGSKFVNALKLAPSHDEKGRLVSFIGIQSDVTIARRREQQEIDRQRLMALGEMAGGVAHQLNNLLLPIISLVSLHHDDIADPDIKSDLGIVLTSARQASDVVRDTLAFSRVNRLPLTVQPVADVVGSNVSFLRSLLPPKVEIEFCVSPDAQNAVALLDATQFCQALANLLMNSANAMDGAGQIEIKVDCDEQGCSVVTVSDRGPGIPVEIRTKVLEPFFTTRFDQGGTGLGLSVVYGIVKTFGGSLSIDDADPCGAQPGCKVTMQLPKAA